MEGLEDPLPIINCSLNKRFRIKNAELDLLTREQRAKSMKEIQGNQTKMVRPKFKGGYSGLRSKFMNKFYLINGFSKQYKGNDQFKTEEELITNLECDHKWPVCLFDFSYKAKITEYLAFQVDMSKVKIIDNHFREFPA
jgi:hypothetical protein